MKCSFKYIFKSTVIVLVAIIGCLPCTTKREIKQVFNVPISQFEHSAKPNKAIVCQTITQELRESALSFEKKDAQQFEHSAKFNKFPAYPSIQANFSVRENNFPASVPIYIFHEQYLI